MNKKRLSLAIVVFLSLALSGCGKEANSPIATPATETANPASTPAKTAQTSERISPEQVQAIAIAPAEIVLPPRTADEQGTKAQSLQISARLANGQDVSLAKITNTDEIDFTSSDPKVVSVDKKGELTVAKQAETGDTATITASYHGKKAKAHITIKYSLAATVKVNADGVEVVTNPDDVAVVANKKRNLPADYAPDDLVVPNVPFSYNEIVEKRHLRKIAADALEALFAGAKKDGIYLYGVSGYRSYKTQVALFAAYVKQQGEEAANRFSARPGQSEHQTGLAIDVSSESAGFALDEKFGETKEGQWLAEHAHEYGFIIRYPKDKEAITGYIYEPWHIRYVGKKIAAEVYESGLTLEEYFQDAGTVPASGK
ncbi:MAG TPA: M15 family metallopeptidase [Bacilli bacterium]